MLRNISKYAITLIMIVASAGITEAYGATRGWEPVKTERTDVKTIVRETDIEIKSASGVIIVQCNHPTQIKIFTILGRTVSSETIPAGRSQLQLPAHGVYIVQIGDLTCKVAV